jgi:tRNA A37 threonylcarbamoyladenosine modification protein TsaB
MKDLILVFDCSAVTDAIVLECLANDQSLARDTVAFSSEQSQHLLSSVQQVCATAHVSFNELAGIALIYGGERFTVSRLGAVTANALAWSQQIPVCGFESRVPAEDMLRAFNEVVPGTPVIPRYSKEPNITI